MRIKLPRYSKQIHGQIHLSSSKSESNRALIIDALAGGRLTLKNLSDARDTQTMIRLLGGKSRNWDVLDAGTTMRFCTAFLAIYGQNHTITGTDRMKQRPIGVLVDALRAVGAQITYLEKDGFPPLKIDALESQRSDSVAVPGNISSQYISALLMIAPSLPKGLNITFTSEIFSRPYIDMTLGIMQKFGVRHTWHGSTVSVKKQEYLPGVYTIESDWSGASYWYSMVALRRSSELQLTGLRKDSLQGDQAIAEIMTKLGVKTSFTDEAAIISSTGTISDHLHLDFKKCPDLAQTVLVTASALGVKMTITGLESLRIKETDRIAAMTNELKKINANLIEQNGTWELVPGSMPEKWPLIKTYEDHRMAMAFAPLCLIGETIIEDPDVVNKSYPSFWKHIAAMGVHTSVIS